MLEVHRAEDPLADEAGPIGHLHRREVVDVDPELDPLHPELGERPRSQQPKRADGDSPSTRGRSDDVTGLGLPPFQVDPKVERERAAFLAEWRSGRDATRTDAAIARLERVARGTEPLVPPILDALVAGATLGEVCDTMRRIFGEHRPGPM